MKVLGIKQFHQKTFKLMKVNSERLAALLGKVPQYFICVIYGFSGNGKTEFCIQMAKELSRHGKVAWLSYEQGHGYDLQLATKRNKMSDHNGKFLVIDPTARRDENKTFVQELDEYLTKRNSPDYVFIDSVDYMNLTWDEYMYLKEKYSHRKGIIFIGHATKGGQPIKRITSRIIFDGGMGLRVSNYIATPEKNRFGGFTPYVVWEEKARELNPAFFAKQEPPKPKSKSAAKVSEPVADKTHQPITPKPQKPTNP